MGGLDQVRAALEAAEDVDLPEGLDLPPEDPGADPVGAAGPGAGGASGGGSDDPAQAPPERACAALPLNDVGNGRRFVVYYGADLIHVPRVGWYVWDGRRYQHDPDAIAARRLAQQVSGRIELEAAHVSLSPRSMAMLAEEDEVRAALAQAEAEAGGEKTDAVRAARAKLERIAEIRATMAALRKSHRRHAVSSGNRARIDAMLIEGAVGDVARQLEALDADPLAINTESGLVRFSVSGGAGEGYTRTAEVTLAPHARGQLMTKLAPVGYDARAPRPVFDAFIGRIQPDPEMRAFLGRWFGLSMTGITAEQKLAFFYGAGANGKSVLVDIMARVFGDYAASAKIESLTGRNRRGGGDATPDLVPLMGARMVRASEPEEGERLQEGIIKELTGGEPILVRALHADFVEVRPEFKLTISGNHKPEIRGTDDGIWRRVLMVPFDVQIPAAERDATLPARLWAERDGIFAWACEGLMDYLEGGLREPQTVRDATAEYRADSDPVGVFLTEACVVTGAPVDSVGARELAEGFAVWLHDQGQGAWRPNSVARRLKEKSGRWASPATGQRFTQRKSSSMHYDGVRFTDVFKRRLSEVPRDSRGNLLFGVQSDAQG